MIMGALLKEDLKGYLTNEKESYESNGEVWLQVQQMSFIQSKR